MAAMLGVWTASFLLAGLLPAAFVFYGRSNDKTWVTVIGATLGILLTLGNLVGNGINPGGIAALLLLGYAFTKHYPRKFPTDPPLES